MGGNIYQDTAITFFLEEPFRSGWNIYFVRSQPDSLDYTPDSAGLHQFPGPYSGAVIQTLPIIHRNW